MAISSLDNIVSSVSAGKSFKGLFQKATSNGATSAAGRWHEMFTAAGIPTAGSFSGTAGVATQLTAASTGALNVGTAAVSPDIKHLLNMSVFTPTATGVPSQLVLCDFLLYYPACVVTGTPTTMDNTATLPRYTSGNGVQCIVAAQSIHGAASPVLTLNYRDPGDNDQAASTITSPVNSAPISSLYTNTNGPFLQLAGADAGVKRINSYTLSSGTTGTVAFILVKPLAVIPTMVINTVIERDFLAQIPALPKIEDNACLGFLLMTGASMVSSCSYQGFVEAVWG